MKMLTMVLVLLILCSAAPVFAIFCSSCGKDVPDAANYCPWCGTVSPGAITAVPSASAVTSAEGTLADYHYVSQMENLLNNNNYTAASLEAKALRRQHDRRLAEVAPRYSGYSAYQRKLHDLQVKKFRALNDYFEAWGQSERGIDRARAKAERDKARFALARSNEAIDILLAGGGSLASLIRAEEVERSLLSNSRNHRVTSSYLIIDNHRLPRGEPIWVIEVASGFARVMHMGNGLSAVPIVGWISIYDLERRTTWRLDPGLFGSPPPPVVVYRTVPEPPLSIIFFDEPDYRPRYYRHRPRWPYHSNRPRIKHRPDNHHRRPPVIRRPPGISRPPGIGRYPGKSRPPGISRPPVVSRPPVISRPPAIIQPPAIGRPIGRAPVRFRPGNQRPPPMVNRPPVISQPHIKLRPGNQRPPPAIITPHVHSRPDQSRRPWRR